MEEHSGRCYSDSYQRWEDSACQKIYEVVLKCKSFWFMSWKNFIEEVCCQFFILRRHLSISFFVEDLEYFKVCHFPSLLKAFGLLFEDFDKFEKLYFGDVLNFIDFLKDREYFLNDQWFFLSLDWTLLHGNLIN